MKNLKRLAVAMALALVLSASAFAGEILTPPCAPPDPGEILTPPCAAQMLADDSTIPGEVSSPPASNTLDIFSAAEAALNLMLLF